MSLLSWQKGSYHGTTRSCHSYVSSDFFPFFHFPSLMVFLSIGMTVYLPFRVRLPEHVSKFELTRLRMGMTPEIVHKNSSEQVLNASSMSDYPQRHQQIRSHNVTQTLHHKSWSVYRGGLSLSVGWWSVHRLLQNIKIEDTREHAYTKNFRYHGGTLFQWNCDFTDWHPFFVYSLGHDSEAAPAIVFEASIPETTYRFPCSWGVFPIDINFLSSLCANVGPVACFLVLFPLDLLHEVFGDRGRRDSSSLPPWVQDFSDFPMVSWYFIPWANSPLSHLQATLMTPQICTVDPFSRLWIVLSPGPKSLGVLFFKFLSVFLGEFHFCQNVGGEFVLACNHHVPHVRSIVPTTTCAFI